MLCTSTIQLLKQCSAIRKVESLKSYANAKFEPKATKCQASTSAAEEGISVEVCARVI